MKDLIVFYSLEGSTKAMAERIAERTGADLLELVPEKDVDKDSNSKFMRGGAMATFGKGTPLKPYDQDFGAYERIIIGTPIWAGKPTPAINQFIKENNAADRVIAAFTLSGSGNDKKCMKKLKEAFPNIKISAAFFDERMAKKEKSSRNGEAFESFIKELEK